MKRAFVAALTVALPAGFAYGHGANPAVAYLNEPKGVGTVVDESFLFTWVDADMPIPTGTATVDFLYTNQQPATFEAGTVPDDLVGELIVEGIIEKEMPNEHVWDTSAVPAGSYLIWSRVIEPPEEFMAPQIIDFSPGVLTIAHSGDPVHPAVLLTEPSSPFKFANESFEITYEAFDPDGTATVRIDVGRTRNPDDFVTIADGLPADETGGYVWDTAELDEGDWILRATITDDRGLSFTHYARYFLLITHAGPRPDAGVRGDAAAPPPDGGTTQPGPGPTPAEPSGCTCTNAGAASDAAEVLGLALVALALIRRRRPSAPVA